LSAVKKVSLSATGTFVSARPWVRRSGVLTRSAAKSGLWPT